MNVLKDGTRKSYTRLSRYSVTPIYYNTLTKKYDTATSQYLNDKTTFSLYNVKENDTYDLIANYFYNNPSYYWIVCSFNHIIDPFEEPKKGTVLKIPSISMIEFE